LFFADGGLIALGCNIFNMGVIPCLVVYPVVFKPFLKKEITNTRITIASIISVVLALQLGAFAVVLQTVASKITQLPFGAFCAAMLPIHLAIGLLEGVITAFVLIPVFKMRPEILESVQKNIPLKEKISVKNVIIAFGVVAAIVGIVFSFFASGKPDGLEWSMEKVAGTAELETTAPLFESAAKVQEGLSFLPDYNFKNAEEKSQGIQIFGTSFSGLVGMILTFAFAALIAVAITYSKKKISAKSTK
jgi:cobalt/nickel transport system permease protein